MHRSKYFSHATYFDRHFNLQAVKILPGEYHATGSDTLITTLLGSCVSACLFDPVSRVGGMNHYMLPGTSGTERGDDAGSARYGVHAMELLVEHLLQLGANPASLTAKVFGAGRVMEKMSDVGQRNAEFALRYLKEREIAVTALDLGDIYPRKVCFFPASGRVFVKRVRAGELPASFPPGDAEPLPDTPLPFPRSSELFGTPHGHQSTRH